MKKQMFVETEKVTSLFDSIRAKSGSTDLMSFDTAKSTIDELKGGGGVIEVEELPKVKWEGTAVPDSGFVDKVYLNKNVSNEDVFNILQSLNIIDLPDTGYIYPICANSDFSKFLIVSTSYEENEDGSVTMTNYQIFNEKFEIVFMNAWNQNIEYLTLGYENVLSLLAPQIGGLEVQNDKLSSILSITPFEGGEEAEEGSIYKDYDDDKYYLLKNKNFINLSTKLIESKTLPVITNNIEVPNNKEVYGVYFNTNLSISETVSILENLTYYNFNGLKANIILNDINNQYVLAVIIDGSVCTIQEWYSNYVFFVNKKIDRLNFVGWNPDFNGFYKINIKVRNNWSQYSLPVGTENSLISKLFSVKPFLEERYIEEGDIIKVPNTGTTVPNSGLIEKIYFNRDKSEEEFYNLLNNSVTFIDASSLGLSGFSFYPVLAYLVDSIPYVLAFKKMSDTDIDFALINFSNMFTIQDFYIGDVGWQFFKNPYNIGYQSMSSLSGIPIGTENNLLSNLISITPFDNTMYVYENGNYVQLVKNE